MINLFIEFQFCYSPADVKSGISLLKILAKIQWTHSIQSVPRSGEIKKGRMRWTAQAVCMENKQDIKHCTFRTSRKYTTWDT